MDMSLYSWMPTIAALGIGLLIGMEREYRQRKQDDNTRPTEPAGIRTFALVALIGNLLTWLPDAIRPWFLLLGFAAIVILAILAYTFSNRTRKADIGITSETVLLITYVLGILTGIGYVLPATIIAILIFALLSYKKLLHRFSHSLSPVDLRQALQFLIVSLVIFPILPDQGLGPFQALNPRHVWLMVVLISGIGFAAYVAIKIFGQRIGLGLTGLMGGFISSTAVTLSMSRLAHKNSATRDSCALAILLACGVMFPRIWFFTLMFKPEVALQLAIPVLVIVLYTLLLGWMLWQKTARADQHGQFDPEFNPLSLLMALGVAAFFALIMLLVHAARYYFGDSGILMLGAISGLTDVDAITLTLLQMPAEAVSQHTITTAILIAAASNTLVKLGMGMIFAPTAMRSRLLIGLLPMIAISLGGIWLF
ncbi:MAG: MgtC/SapB family protein [Mariprofundus sp.]|nr:MgtC/SapB family protein [Mariprofundus sp.]